MKFPRPIVALAGDATAVSTATALCDAINGATTASLKLTADITIDANTLGYNGDGFTEFKVTTSNTVEFHNKSISLDLNGHVFNGNIKLVDDPKDPGTVLTLIDSNPTATHEDTTLPQGGVINGDITLTKNTGDTQTYLYANGGTVTETAALSASTAHIYCTSSTPTVFKGNVGGISTGYIHGGLYYGTIKTTPTTNIIGKTITFKNGDETYAIEVLSSSNTAVKPIDPTKTGYSFTGWYTGETEYTFGNTVSVDTTLTAKFTPTSYSLTYELGGGTATNPASYTIESGDFTLANPTREGYTFAGWSIGDATPTTTMTISKGSTGNRTYTAHWKDITAPVIACLENGKTYCGAVDFTVTDNEEVKSVTANGTPLTADTDGTYTLTPATGTQKIVATDDADNSVEMTVTVNDGHSGGTADCTHKAICSVCSEEYGEANGHTMTHTEAKAATADTDGNTEYWHCDGCGKYFADKDGKTEIRLADTVIAKLGKTQEPTTEAAKKAPPTGDNSLTALWLAALLIGCAALLGLGRKKHTKA